MTADPWVPAALGSTAARALLGSAFRVDEADRDAAFAGLVADLRVAGQAVA